MSRAPYHLFLLVKTSLPPELFLWLQLITSTSPAINPIMTPPHTLESITIDLHEDDKVKLAGVDVDGVHRGKPIPSGLAGLG